MSSVLKWQGMGFVILAIIITVGTFAMPQPDERTALIIIAVLIIVLGVPHGAFDTIFAHKLYGIKTVRGWALGSVAYGLLSLLVVGIWMIAPTVFLAGFLLISAAHFSGDPRSDSLKISRVLYGGAVIVLPTLRHADEVNRLFGLVADPNAAAFLTPWLAALAWPWLVALLISFILEFPRHRLTAFELLAVGILCTITFPLVGFTVFFCLMHSARHILRTFDYAKQLSPWLIIGAGIMPMVLVLIGAAIAWALLEGVALETRIVQIIFVGLAALTVPHMALVERVRLSGWRPSVRSL